MATVGITFQINEDLLEALDAYAGANNQARARVMRDAIAAFIGYEEGGDLRTKRTPKYASEEERKEAQLQRNRIRRQGVRIILEAQRTGATREELEAKLAEIGLKLEDF